MKLGVVGTGKIAYEIVPHLGAWGYEVRAVCSTPRSAEKARVLAAPYGAETYTDYAEMLAHADIEAVYVALPNNLHFSHALAALEAGRHVILEKPIAATVRQAEKLALAARERGLFLYEAITTLYQPNYLRIKELLPRIGQVRVVTCNYSQYSSRYDAFRAGTVLPAFDPACAGGALMDLGLYNVQYIVGLFGAPERVSYMANVERDIDTSGVMTMDYGSFKAVSIAAKDCGAPTQNVIQGNDGYILQTTPAGICGTVTLHMNDGREETFDENPPLRFEAEFRAFVAGVENGDLEGCYRTLDHSVAVSRAMTEARLSAGVRFPADDEQ